MYVNHFECSEKQRLRKNKESLLTLAIAERPVLLTAGGWLRGRARDGVAEYLLLGRLQHKAVGFNQHMVRTRLHEQSHNKFHSHLRRDSDLHASLAGG